MNTIRLRTLLAGALASACAMAAHAALPLVPSPALEAGTSSGGSSMLQAVLGTLVVVGAIFLCAWLGRRFGVHRMGGNGLVKVVSTSMVGQRERVVVVEVAGTWLVLGVTAQNVQTLHTLPAQASHDAAPAQPLPSLAPFALRLRDSLSARLRPTP
ncbi:flagellar biosynthetic protein FliO [Variovorax ginsengisoli]|uniref:Flagellar protein n=1 Tax=Variovorax ginsengisoli TaxID=363844 RepID=A0ABT9SD58_9BURK|nr:flagellar biosynthetic protein FliO [Variovorax ginsengisoli]MDP9902291.1 flagellar protein FliO/FliZ [Variovorax ginsengisoli]